MISIGCRRRPARTEVALEGAGVPLVNLAGSTVVLVSIGGLQRRSPLAIDVALLYGVPWCLLAPDYLALLLFGSIFPLHSGQ